MGLTNHNTHNDKEFSSTTTLEKEVTYKDLKKWGSVFVSLEKPGLAIFIGL